MLCILYIRMYIILKYTHVYKYIHTYVYIYTRFFICPHMRSSPSPPWPVVALYVHTYVFVFACFHVLHPYEIFPVPPLWLVVPPPTDERGWRDGGRDHIY